MSNTNATIVPRRRRDEAQPSAPLDPYVTTMLRWIAGQNGHTSLNSLAQRAAATLNWPLPFAEAVITAARARRLLTFAHTGSRGREAVELSARGRQWLTMDASNGSGSQPVG